MPHSLTPDQLLDRIATVSAMLHEEQGDREELQWERAELVEEARWRGLINPPSAH